MNHLETMDKILERYKFRKDIPDAAKKNIERSKKDTLKAILKKNGSYGIITSLIISVFLFAKKTGIPLSIVKCTIIVWTAIALGTGIVAGGTFYTVKSILPPAGNPALEERAPVSEKTADTQEKSGIVSPATHDTQAAAVLPYEIGIMPFESSNLDAALRERATGGSTRSLVMIRGTDKVGMVGRGSSGRQADRLLLGSIEKLNTSYQITLRVVEAKTTKIILFLNERAESEDTIEDACRRLSEKVSGILFR